ncbi:phosphotransferase family protein [Microtetraspora sp. NBRC 16547]|uniref:phosphotransferase family protein n=1 Tax=Microtetraspora sp. NBRC 16547 TaxID=3030993 RepID=UPI0024A1928F|nr:phosphotransferase family protein [Microtetraspora sp. NBRC 16547]GLW99380.1 acyl-CoA dehydrogenase [Microtetraspora sp. NBRC 16547]
MPGQDKRDIAPSHDDPPGVDLARVSAYLADAAPELVSGPLRAEVIAGGKSNLTYLVSDGASEWILRRPPLGHVLATAHDMAREYRVISALGPTDVPVPRTYALCEDPGVIGAPFYVMEKVEGTPYRTASQLEPLGRDRTRAICTRMVDTLAVLHAVDPAAVALSDFGRPDGFLQRQVRRWKKQLDASYSRDLAGAEELHRLLLARVPGLSAPAIVHGDFRLDNLLVDTSDDVVSVLDWEMATLGDCLTDFALMLVYQRLATSGIDYAVSDVSTAPGYLSDSEIMNRYSVAGGRPLTDMGFYLGLAYFKLAVILEGIHYRHIQGKTVGAGFDTVGTAVEPLIKAGLDSVRENH